MTKQEAKELSIEVWEYLAAHPEIDDKKKLPNYIFDKIEWMLGGCPLCQLYRGESDKRIIGCFDCPLYPDHCFRALNDSSFWKWLDSGTDADRRHYATLILNAIKAWDIKE